MDRPAASANVPLLTLWKQKCISQTYTIWSRHQFGSIVNLTFQA